MCKYVKYVIILVDHYNHTLFTSLPFKATMNTSPSNGEPDGNIPIVAAQGTDQSKDVVVAQETNQASSQRSQVDEAPGTNQPIDAAVAQDTNQVSSQSS